MSTVAAQSSRARIAESADPAGTARGSVLVLPGRGDDPRYYRRLATRLAVDGYAVRVAAAPVAGADDVAELWRATAPEGGVGVIVAVDAAAPVTAAALAAGTVRPAGAVFAGTAIEGGELPSAEDELAARSACPVHRGVVAAAPASPLAEGAVTPWPEESAPLPVLVIHGAADTIAPVSAVLPRYDRWRAETVTVADGLHDVLNDVHHRTVAAEIVQFLERLRADPDARPLLTRGAAR